MNKQNVIFFDFYEKVYSKCDPKKDNLGELYHKEILKFLKEQEFYHAGVENILNIKEYVLGYLDEYIELVKISKSNNETVENLQNRIIDFWNRKDKKDYFQDEHQIIVAKHYALFFWNEKNYKHLSKKKNK